MRYKFIDTDEEYIQTLDELNQLDDMDDWHLYVEQEKRLDTEVDTETWLKYVKKRRIINKDIIV